MGFIRKDFKDSKLKRVTDVGDTWYLTTTPEGRYVIVCSSPGLRNLHCIELEGGCDQESAEELWRLASRRGVVAVYHLDKETLEIAEKG